QRPAPGPVAGTATVVLPPPAARGPRGANGRPAGRGRDAGAPPAARPRDLEGLLVGVAAAAGAPGPARRRPAGGGGRTGGHGQNLRERHAAERRHTPTPLPSGTSGEGDGGVGGEGCVVPDQRHVGGQAAAAGEVDDA